MHMNAGRYGGDEGSQRVRFGEHSGRVNREPVHLQAAKNSSTGVDEGTAKFGVGTKQEVTKDLRAWGRFGSAANLEVETGATTRTPPIGRLCCLELPEKVNCFGGAVLKHPAREPTFVICQRTRNKRVGHDA